MPDPVDFVVLPVAISFGVTLVVGLLALAPGNWTRKWGGAVFPVALAAGLLATFGRITGSIPGFPPPAAMSWIFYLTILAGLADALVVVCRTPRRVRLIVVLLVSAISFTVIFRNPLRDPQASATLVQLIVVSCLVGGLWWWIMDSAATNLERLTAPLALLVLALAGGMLMMLSGSATYGRMGLALAGALAALLVLTPFREDVVGGCAAVVVPVLGSILLAGSYYALAEHRWANLALIASAPLLMSVRGLIPVVRGRSKAGLFISLSLLVIPLVVAGVITVARFLQDSAPATGGYEY